MAKGDGDIVLPPRGGWVIIKRRLPANLPQVPLFSIFYAMPERAFARGSFEGTVYGQHLKSSDLWLLYRDRHTQSKLSTGERDRVAELDKDAVEYIDAPLELEMRVKIRTPDGDVCVEPHEWTPCGDVQPYMNAIGTEVTMHEYGDAAPHRKIGDALFYLRSRGIAKVDAIQMLFGAIRSPNVLWLELSPELVAFFDRENRPVRRTLRTPMQVKVHGG